VVLRRTDQQGFERCLAAVENPRSPLYRHFLTQRQLAARFGPSRQAYGAVLGWLRSQGRIA
jgi:kumamolisin